MELINENDLKICDFKRHGNVIRFYLTWLDDNDYEGDDWDDAPFEHNAGIVYASGWYIDIAFPMDVYVTDPSDDWHYNGNSPFCKDDFKKQKAPCIIIGKPGEYEDQIYYSLELGNQNMLRIYYDTKLADLLEMIKTFDGRILLKDYRKVGVWQEENPDSEYYISNPPKLSKESTDGKG